MLTKLTDMRDVVLLSVACIAGAMLTPVFPFVGIPLCAASLGGLVYRERSMAAALVAIMATVVGGWLRPGDMVAVGLAVLGILSAAQRLRRADVYQVGVWLGVVLGVGMAGAEYMTARLNGLTIREYMNEAASQATVVLGNRAFSGMDVDAMTKTMIQFAPAVYVMLGFAVVVPTLYALVWSARRADAVIRPVPKLDRTDLSPHVLWPLVTAVLLMAAGRVWGGSDGVLMIMGLNLLLVVRVALLVQGLALVAALLRAGGTGRVALVIGVVVALLVDAATWVVSMAGLLDFWINFRRLDRGTGSEGIEGPAEGL
ncbi:MAG: DUF2232 domain-containing protein [Coriobacteriia bacterium]|nr:DUF2232 domain-containing protein [Coriobacteriia bacterium]